ncbi:MAG: LysE family translocator [Pseudomonadota bacterium]
MPISIPVPDWPVLVAFSFAVAILNITPGPDMTYQINRALVEGRRAAFVALAGTNTGFAVHVLLAAFGVSALIAASPTAYSVLKYVGAFYLLWLAVQAIRTGSRLDIQTEGKPCQSDQQTFLAAIMINILNPKVILFFVTFLPQFVSANDGDAGGKLIFLSLYALVFSLLVSVPLLFVITRFLGALKNNKRILRVIDYVFAGVFGAFAARILLSRPA